MSRIKRLELIETIGLNLQKNYVTSDINAYLGGFGIKATEDSVSSKRVYVKTLLSNVENELIEEIATDLGIFFEPLTKKRTKIEDEDISTLWKSGTLKLFVSHLSSDKAQATALQKALVKYGVSSFVAHVDIKPSLKWIEEIEKALRTMDAMVAIISEDYHLSEWCDQEVGWALGRDILLIPLNRGANPYGFMGQYQAVMTKGKKASEVAERVLEILKSNPKTQKIMENL